MAKVERKVYTIRWANVKRAVIWMVFFALVMGNVLFVQYIVIKPNEDLCPHLYASGVYVLRLFYSQVSVLFIGVALALTITVQVWDLPEHKEKSAFMMLSKSICIGSYLSIITGIGLVSAAFVEPTTIVCMKENAPVLYYTGFAISITPYIVMAVILGLAIILFCICGLMELLPKLPKALSKAPMAIKDVFVAEEVILETV